MEKQRWEESEKRRAEERRSEKRKSGKKEDSGARKRSASRETAGAERSGQMKDEKLHAVVVRSTFGSEKIKAVSRSERFWRLSCGKRARHCGAKHVWTSKYARHTPCSDLFSKLRCSKSGRRCGTKHISRSKCTKDTILGPLLEVEMSKKCTPLWREVRVEVKMYKTHHSWTTFGS